MRIGVQVPHAGLRSAWAAPMAHNRNQSDAAADNHEELREQQPMGRGVEGERGGNITIHSQT